MSSKSFNTKRFRNIGVVTIASVYFLILVGGIVRSTGSGMGCPDWPKCFGSWVPPTNINQLPKDYLEVYRDKRIQKNVRLAGHLEKIGLEEVANKMLSNPTAFIETSFNPTKTWIEYVNRLVGVVIGFLIILTLYYSFPYLKIDKAIFYLSFLSFLVVVFQGWLGSLVVSTNLLPEMVTIHMALALVLIALLIYAIARSQKESLQQRTFIFSSGLFGLLWVILAFSFAQILLGTQVRESIDQIAFDLNYSSREDWIGKLNLPFYIHRSFSWIVLLLNVFAGYQIFKLKDALLNMLITTVLGLIFLEIFIGVGLANFAIPASLQPLHLLLATLIFGAQFTAIIVYHYATRAKGVARIFA
ncbi:COX15/CtaA family protein [Adhaeribacter aquaticus]|uniref:COX15/CtaA family protein n=1 Tax=Adhaeribacter aquaticus TaxID=299567 RepID=UPI0003F9CDD1|nr:COX15/CtaA family protein [Adhaeribacter aquaticus]